MRKNIERSGCHAYVYYRGGAVGEETVEDHTTGEPVEIIIGAGEVPKGIDTILYDLDIGEERIVVIPCSQAYGPRDPDGVQRYPRLWLKNGEDIHEGVVLGWRHPVSGVTVPVRCVAETEDTVTIDFNHFLAGKDLEYWFKLIDITD